jgi:hypothetical protein
VTVYVAKVAHAWRSHDEAIRTARVVVAEDAVWALKRFGHGI